MIVVFVAVFLVCGFFLGRYYLQSRQSKQQFDALTQLMEQARQIARDVINDCLDENNHDWNDVKNKVKDQMTRFLSAKTGRKPMILPIIMDV